ncbi:MAG: hypothetical protein AAF502_20860 [Bacteroidota bacterium]
MIKVITSFAIIIFAFNFCSSAQDISGDYLLTANGHTFLMVLNQDGSEITGRLENISNKTSPAQSSLIKGKIEGRKISFTRENSMLVIPQEYSGFLFQVSSDNELDQKGMAGVFSDMSRPAFSWFATPLD